MKGWLNFLASGGIFGFLIGSIFKKSLSDLNMLLLMITAILIFFIGLFIEFKEVEE